MLKAIWKFILMIGGISSEEDEQEAERARRAERQRLERESAARPETADEPSSARAHRPAPDSRR